MSKAFTREENAGADIPILPLQPSILPPGAKNYMTRNGAERLQNELRSFVEQERPRLAAAAIADSDAKRQLAVLDQRIYQLEQSLQSAEIISPPTGSADTVRFGATVTVREQDGEESRYRIVGVDETDIDRGWVSWLSPIARALINAQLGEGVRFKSPSGEQDLEIVSITYE